jgi:hypothetical protein
MPEIPREKAIEPLAETNTAEQQSILDFREALGGIPTAQGVEVTFIGVQPIEPDQEKPWYKHGGAWGPPGHKGEYFIDGA